MCRGILTAIILQVTVVSSKSETGAAVCPFTLSNAVITILNRCKSSYQVVSFDTGFIFINNVAI